MSEQHQGFTAGPWEAVYYRYAGQIRIKQSLDALHEIAILPMRNAEEAEANARLIAAAPELIWAAERLAGKLGKESSSEYAEAVDALHTAINKARRDGVR